MIRLIRQISNTKRLPFKEVEKLREEFDPTETFRLTQSPNPNWRVGQGANNDDWEKHQKLPIDPYSDDRTPNDNYKTLIGAITPRPIGLVSSVSSNGIKNLAPFSYFQVVNADPPIFTLGLSQGQGIPKDSLRNVLETKELTINIISEWFVEAANATCTNAPFEEDEWKLSGLTPQASTLVKPPHVAESAFSIEAKLLNHHNWHSKTDPNRTTGTLLIVEGMKFHIRQDVINEDKTIDVSKLKPIARLGGITYAKLVSGFEIPRPDYLNLKEELESSKSDQ